MSANGKEKIIEYLKSNILVTDGAMGTYFASLYDTKEPPEYCNIKDSKKIYDIKLTPFVCNEQIHMHVTHLHLIMRLKMLKKVSNVHVKLQVKLQKDMKIFLLPEILDL